MLGHDLCLDDDWGDQGSSNGSFLLKGIKYFEDLKK